MTLREQLDAAFAAGCLAAFGAWIGSALWAFGFGALAGGVIVSLGAAGAARKNGRSGGQ